MVMQHGILYIVATPIGNLEDITLRAIRVLKEVGLIAAEDTRRTRILLDAYGIDTPLTSLHDYNEREKSSSLIARLREGTSIAYVSDAGTPGISDPGYLLVRQAIDQSIRIVPIPGPVAAVAALNVSGLPMDSFSFFAFLPTRGGKRRQLLESIKDETKTLVFYESPNRLSATLEDMQKILGDRQIAVSRELTKLYEETIRGTVGEVIATLRGKKVKGEITLVVSGGETATPDITPEAIRERVEKARGDPAASTRDMVDTISEELHVPRKKVYRIVLDCIKEAEDRS